MRIPDLSAEATKRRLAVKSARAPRIDLTGFSPSGLNTDASRSDPARVPPRSVLRPFSGSALLPPVPSKSPRQRLRTVSAVAARAAVALLALVTLSATGLFWGASKGMEAFKWVRALDPNSVDIINPAGQEGDEDFLLIGADTREGDNSKLGAGDTTDVEGSRSDTIILVNIPASRARVVAVSFPRDLQVDRPECVKWDSTTGKYSKEKQPAEIGAKLNSVYMYGGPKCLVRVIQKLSGLKVNHFVGEDFEGFSQLVDAVGGVQVCSRIPLRDNELGWVLQKTGPQVLDGEHALQYVRARQIPEEGNGDYGRIKRQQRFISSLLRSMLSQKVLTNPGKLQDLIKAFTSRAVVDGVNMDDLLVLAKSMQNIQTNKVTFITIPTLGSTTDFNEIPNIPGIRAIFDAIINDTPLPGEGGVPTASTTTSSSKTTTTTATAAPAPAPAPETKPADAQAANPKDFTVKVVAPSYAVLSKVTAALTKQGFRVASTEVAPAVSVATIARFSPDRRGEAAAVASSVQGTVIEQASTPDADVELVVGAGDAPAVAAPAKPGTTISTNEAASVGGGYALPEDLTVTNAADTTC